jgi:hypothetical protein
MIHIILKICANEKIEILFINFLQQCTQLYNLIICNVNSVQKKIISIFLLNNISLTILWKN